RHAVGRADEPEPLFVGGDPLPAGASTALAGAGGDRQDRGQQQHDRPGRPQAGPTPLRGAGRFQMVCTWSFRRHVLLWRRGKRRGELLAPRRHVWTTDKDGPIMDLLAAEITARTGKDPGEHYR